MSAMVILVIVLPVLLIKDAPKAGTVPLEAKVPKARSASPVVPTLYISPAVALPFVTSNVSVSPIGSVVPDERTAVQSAGKLVPVGPSASKFCE